MWDDGRHGRKGHESCWERTFLVDLPITYGDLNHRHGDLNHSGVTACRRVDFLFFSVAVWFPDLHEPLSKIWKPFNRSIYPPVIKHGLLENGPLKSVMFLSMNLHSVRGFSNIFQLAIFETRGFHFFPDLRTNPKIFQIQRSWKPLWRNGGQAGFRDGVSIINHPFRANSIYENLHTDGWFIMEKTHPKNGWSFWGTPYDSGNPHMGFGIVKKLDLFLSNPK